MNDLVEIKVNILADDYKLKKQKSLLNILHCGKILNDAKQMLKHGEWLDFLSDLRVSESERTAQRLMSIFKNYRHLVDEDKFMQTDALTQLGVSHLLELQKLPDRFKKEFNIKKEENGFEVEETVKVIDEEKLSDFLEQRVEFEGSLKPVRDLPLSEMKKYIQEAQGVFINEIKETIEEESDDEESNPEPEYDTSGFLESPSSSNDREVKKEKYEDRGEIVRALKDLSNFHTDAIALVTLLNKIDLSMTAVMSPKQADSIAKESARVSSICEAVIVACLDLKDRI